MLLVSAGLYRQGSVGFDGVLLSDGCASVFAPKTLRASMGAAVRIPVIGLGGISNATDAIEFFMAGASAIEIGTANFIDPAVTIKVRDGINDWLDAHGCRSLSEIVGALHA